MLLFVESLVESEKTQSVDFTLTQHILVCALHELGCLIQTLGTSASSLVTEPSTGETTLLCCLPKASVVDLNISALTLMTLSKA